MSEQAAMPVAYPQVSIGAEMSAQDPYTALTQANTGTEALSTAEQWASPYDPYAQYTGYPGYSYSAPYTAPTTAAVTGAYGTTPYAANPYDPYYNYGAYGAYPYAAPYPYPPAPQRVVEKVIVPVPEEVSVPVETPVEVKVPVPVEKPDEVDNTPANPPDSGSNANEGTVVSGEGPEDPPNYAGSATGGMSQVLNTSVPPSMSPMPMPPSQAAQVQGQNMGLDPNMMNQQLGAPPMMAQAAPGNPIDIQNQQAMQAAQTQTMPAPPPMLGQVERLMTPGMQQLPA